MTAKAGAKLVAEYQAKRILELETELAVARNCLRALVSEVTCPCAVNPSTGKLAKGEEPMCEAPARWGMLTGWSCDAHRRPEDRNEMGGPALRAAFALLAEE